MSKVLPKELMKYENQMIEVTQIASGLHRPDDQQATLIGLGLGKINRSHKIKATRPVMGMIKKVSHLVKVMANDHLIKVE